MDEQKVEELLKRFTEECKELIVLANQSGKQETSNIVLDVLRRLDDAIAVGIEKNVNGKIRNLTAIVETHIKKTEEHIENDKEWKRNMSQWKNMIAPDVQTVSNTRITVKTLKDWMGLIALISGAISPVVALIYFLKK